MRSWSRTADIAMISEQTVFRVTIFLAIVIFQGMLGRLKPKWVVAGRLALTLPMTRDASTINPIVMCFINPSVRL